MHYNKLQRSVLKGVVRAVKPAFDDIVNLETQLAFRPNVVHATEDSPKRFEIVSEMLNIELQGLPLHGFPKSGPLDAFSLAGMKYALRSLGRNPSQPKTQASPEFIRQLQDVAASLDVSSIGYAENPEHLIFQGKALLHENMIVVTMEMDRAAIANAPSNATAAEVHWIYARTTWAVLRIAGFLRKNGYSAQACYPLMGPALYPALAQKAGLGWRGAHGLLITPEYGPRVRLGAVSTSIDNLPLSRENKAQWSESYCTKCRQCILKCPVHAIYESPIRHANGLVTCIDNGKCFPEFSNHHGCGICIRVCPFSNRNSELLRKHATLTVEER